MEEYPYSLAYKNIVTPHPDCLIKATYLMRSHMFYREMQKIIPPLSLNTHLNFSDNDILADWPWNNDYL